jgi:hypothetical protein
MNAAGKNNGKEAVPEPQKGGGRRGIPRRYPFLIPILVIAVVVSGCFGYSVPRRSGHFGRLSPSLAGWMTAGTAAMASNWYRENPFRLGFVMYWQPHSIEFPDRESRTTYFSFPSGSIIPIYLLSLARGREADPDLVMAFNLFLHWMTALTLSLLAYYAVRAMLRSAAAATILALIPGIAYIFLPAAWFEHQMGYFSDQAVMPLFALILFLEAVQLYGRRGKTKRLAMYAGGAAAFCGMFTDWLFFFVLLSIYLCRIVRGEMAWRLKPFLLRSIRFWTPAGIAVLLFLLQVLYAGDFAALSDRFFVRTGIGSSSRPAVNPPAGNAALAGALFSTGLDSHFWEHHLPAGLGAWGRPVVFSSAILLVLLLAGAAIFRWRRGPLPRDAVLMLTLSFCALTPCLLYTWVFKAHCAVIVHDFAALKFALPFVLLPFALFPALLLRLLRRPEQPGRFFRTAAILAALLLLIPGLGYPLSLDEERAAQFTSFNAPLVRAARFIGAHTAYEDIVVWPARGVSGGMAQPFSMVYAMKYIHYLRTLPELKALLEDVKGAYVLNLFYREEKGLPEDFIPLRDAAVSRLEEGGMILLKIPRAACQPVLERVETGR